MKQFLLASCLISGALISGCNKEPASDTKKLAIIETELTSLKGEVEALKEAKKNQDAVELLRSFETVAYLTPGESGYSAVHFDLGVLTVQLANVTPYANGSKVVLRFGNTLSSSINGLKATIEWGKVTDKGLADNETAKSKDVTLTETLRGGSWTSIPIVLEGVLPVDLGFIRVRNLAHTGIELIRGK